MEAESNVSSFFGMYCATLPESKDITTIIIDGQVAKNCIVVALYWGNTSAILARIVEIHMAPI
jgi:hypothetical protein